MLDENLIKVDVNKAYKLLNIGATTLVSAEHDNKENIMAAAWACALDLAPTKATVVIDKSHFTYKLMDEDDYFALMIPCLNVAKDVLYFGSISQNDDKDKLENVKDKLFYLDNYKMPMLKGCIGYIVFKKIKDKHMQENYDLFAGVCVEAYADKRVFDGSHFIIDKDIDEGLKTIHYVAGSNFFTLGKNHSIN